MTSTSALPASAGPKGEFSRHWPLVCAGAAGFGLGLSGLPFYTAGVFLDPLMKAFDWKAAEVQSGLVLTLWSGIFLSPLSGMAVDRFGSRRVALVSLLLFGLALMSVGLIGPDLMAFRLRWILVAIAGAGTLPLVWGKVIGLHFIKQRGLALGLVLAGSGMTGFFAPPLASALIDGLGWRGAYAVLGALPIVIALPLVYFILPRDRPGAAPSVSATAVEPLTGFSLAKVLASPRFWIIAICIASVAAAASGCLSNLVKILVTHGHERHAAVWVASLAGLFVVIGRAASGALIDKFWAPGIAAAFFIAPALGCLVMLLAPQSLLAAGAASALIGLAAGAEFDLLAYLLAAYFGLKRFGAIYGFASAVFAFAAGAAPLAFAAILDRTGSYDQALVGAIIAFCVGSIGILWLGPYPHFSKVAS